MEATRSFRVLLYALTYVLAYLGAKIMKKPQYITMYWIGLLGFINVELMVYLTTTKYSDIVNKAYNYCFIQCKNEWCKYLLKFRGKDYFLTFNGVKQGERVKNCLLSLWGILHFVLFAIIGFFVPNVFYEVILISVVYELLEYVLYDCHDALDIVLNIGGYLFGAFLYEMYHQK